MTFNKPPPSEPFKNEISKTPEQLKSEELDRQSKGLRKPTYKDYKEMRKKRRAEIKAKKKARAQKRKQLIEKLKKIKENDEDSD